VTGSVSALNAEIREGIDALLRTEVDASAIPTVTPIRATEGDEFLATKTGATAAAVAGLHLTFGFVDKFHG
jgi:hypothetical protein